MNTSALLDRTFFEFDILVRLWGEKYFGRLYIWRFRCKYFVRFTPKLKSAITNSLASILEPVCQRKRFRKLLNKKFQM